MSYNLDGLMLRHGRIEDYGYRVERYNPNRPGWCLIDQETGAYLNIARYGQVAPTKDDALLEAYRRIAFEDRIGRHAEVVKGEER